MDFLSFLLVCVAVTACTGAPHYPLYRVYIAQPYLQYDLHVPQPSPLVHNSISFKVDPDAHPDDAMEVAQFHSQDVAGRVVFGFNTPDQSRMEARALDGSVRGSYSYQDPTGKIVKMHYWDDGTGFHTVGNNLPASYYSTPGYTPEVQAAREQHFQLYRQALAAALAAGQSSQEYEQQSDHSSVNTDAVVQPAPPADDSNDKPESEPAEAPAEEAVPDQLATDSKNDEPSADYDSDSDAVAIENSDFVSFKSGAPAVTAEATIHRNAEPEAERKQVARLDFPVLVPDLSTLAVARTGADGYQYLVPVDSPAQGHSESLHATLYGAIPVSAVHDTQVSPTQRDIIADHQVKPVLLRTAAARYGARRL